LPLNSPEIIFLAPNCIYACCNTDKLQEISRKLIW